MENEDSVMPQLIYLVNSNDKEEDPCESLSDPTSAEPTPEPELPSKKSNEEPTSEPDYDSISESSAPTGRVTWGT